MRTANTCCNMCRVKGMITEVCNVCGVTRNGCGVKRTMKKAWDVRSCYKKDR